ncbi:MAG: hypothetical protein HYX97_06690 [Chloroflexi bacterium]|nr:hypothetical protein [Chloroflexota bacterium]
MQREEHARLFRGTSTRTFTLTVLEETCEVVRQIAAENGWTEDEANLIIFVNGVSYLQGTAVLEKVSAGQRDVAQTLEKLAKDLQQYMSMYSVMKYQAFLKTRDNESMDMIVNALRAENTGRKNRNDMFREEEERLKRELAHLRSEKEALEVKVAELSVALEVSTQQRRPLGSRPRTWWGWLPGLFSWRR